MSDLTRGRSRLPRPWWWIAACCAVLAAFHVWRIPGAWSDWRAGLPDLYPGQHRRLLFSHVGGLALVLVIPVNTAMAAAGEWPRGRRWALYGSSGVLLAVALTAIVLDLTL